MKIKGSYLIGVQAFLFAIFLLITFFFNRFAIDDYYFIGEVKQSSFKDTYQHLYFHWHGRWTSNFLMVYLIKFYAHSFFLFAYNTVSIGFLYLGVIRLFQTLRDKLQLQLSYKAILLYALIFISVLFFCTISANDSWIWFTSSIVYLWSTIAFFFGLSAFLKKEKNIFDFILLIICAVFIGGANEPLTILMLVALLLLLLKKQQLPASILVLLTISVSFLINYLSPGTLHRDEITPHLSFINLILYTGYSSVKFLLFSIHKTFIPALFLGIPFYLLGKRVQLKNEFRPLKELLKSILLILLIVVVNQLAVVYALGGLSPDRSGIASSIAISILLARYLFLLGNHHQEKYHFTKYVLIVNVVALFAFNVYYAKVHHHYASAVDDRMKAIENSSGQIIEVKPLPTSGYIYSAEITTDAVNFKNQHLKKGLGIEKDIVLVTDQ